MRTKEEVDYFYSTLLEGKIAEMETLRIKTKKSYYILFAIAILIFIVILSIALNREGIESLPVLLWLGIILGTLIVGYIIDLLKKNYVSKFKENIISALIHFYDPSLKYDSERGILPKAVEISGIFSCVDYESDDYVEGRFGKTFIQFSEISLKGSKGRKLFSGLFLIAEFNKYFKGEYLVLPDNYESTFGSLIGDALQKISPLKSQMIKMESPEFEKHFSVFGEDEIEARYLLSPALMERMVDFKSKIGKPVYFSFARSRLFIAISAEENLFEPSVMMPTDKSMIETWGKNIYFALSLVDDLSLNTRIWSKQ